MGLPYWAMAHFTRSVQSSHFETEYRSYCLPVLDPNLISCSEVPFNHTTLTSEDDWVRYQVVDLLRRDDNIAIDNANAYEVSIPSNVTSKDVNDIKYRIDDEGEGVMTVRMYPYEPLINTTIITAANTRTKGRYDGNDGGYASMLYKLMYGEFPDPSLMPAEGPFYFVANCEFTSIKYHADYRPSWRKVDFVLQNGVSRANVTEERCPNPRGNWTSGFDDLFFALEASATVLSGTDGHTILINDYPDTSTGTNIFAGMSRLDAIVNKIYHQSATSWSQAQHQYAMLNQSVYKHPIVETTYPHLYVIHISWTQTTWLGLLLALLITLNAYLLAGRWAIATFSFGLKDGETWNLLRPVDLMAYTLAAYQDLIHDLNTMEHRKATMRGRTHTVLRERPVREGTQSLIGLIETVSASAASSPISPMGEKYTGGGMRGPAVTVNERWSTGGDTTGTPTSPGYP